MLKTKNFGVIELSDGFGTLPPGPGLVRAVELDLAELDGDEESLEAVSAFLDALPTHVEVVHERFAEAFDEIAGFVPGWLKEEAPEIYRTLFPDMPEPKGVDAEKLWSVLNILSIWTSDEPSITLDFGFGTYGKDEMNYCIAAYFDLDGSLTDLSLES